MLNIRATTKPIHHHTRSEPTAVLVLPRQNIKATSISPAIMRIIQFISVSSMLFHDSDLAVEVAVTDGVAIDAI